MVSVFNWIGRKIAGKKIDRIKNALDYADIKTDPYSFLGKNVFFGFLLTFVVSPSTWLIWHNLYYTLFALSITPILFYLAITTFISMLSDQRANFVEETLPDALLLMSANLRSGLPTDEAIILSSRPEFGFLAEKINLAGKKISTGVPFEDAFCEITKGVNSNLLRKTVEIIIEGMKSGGELSTILESTSENIRDNKIIQKEIRSVILVYAIFIFIAAVVTAPMLYAISTHLAETLSKLSKEISITFMMSKSPTLSLKPTEISGGFLMIFAYVNLIITSTFGSFMVSLITKGNEKYGIRYIPIFVLISLVLFYIIRIIVGAFFGAIKI